MSRLLFFLLILLSVGYAKAQRFELSEKKEKLPDGTFSGYQLIIDGTLDDIETQWNDQLRATGKVKKKRAHWEVTEAEFGRQAGLTLGTIVKLRSDSSVSLWLGAKLKKSDNSVDKDVEEYLQAFGQEYYRSRLRTEVERTEEEAIFISRQHQKLLNDNKNLGFELEEAQKEQERLRNALEKVSLEVQVIQQKMEDNRLAAEKLLIELDKTNSRLDGKKSSLKKMN